MKINKFEITEAEDKICVSVELAGHHDKHNPKARYQTVDVVSELEKRNISFDKCIEDASLYNWRDSGLCGTWIFSKKVKKVEKPLDKLVENVIIEVEKEVKPKPVRKRRTTKASTKKVSTGE